MRLNSRRKEEQFFFMKIHKDKFINTLSAKRTQVNERLKRIHEAFNGMVWYGMVILYLMTLAPTAICWFPQGASKR